MSKRVHNAALDLTTLPFLTMRRVCLLADCHRSTVKRSPLRPVGKRGRTSIYKTSDVLAWIAGGTAANDQGPKASVSPLRQQTVTSDPLARLALLRKGGQ